MPARAWPRASDHCLASAALLRPEGVAGVDPPAPARPGLHV